MSDYIKREDAIEAMENRFADIIRTHKRRVTTGEKAIASDMIETAKMVKSADVAPVRHGRLVDAGISASGHRLTMCTICKRKMREGIEIGIVSRYCPNCGVRLDEEAEK